MMWFRSGLVVGMVAISAASFAAPAQAVSDSSDTRQHYYRQIVIDQLPGFQSSSANAVNDRGQVVGGSWTPFGNGHAFLWQRGELTDLGAFQPGDYSDAADINERGDVVGRSAVGYNFHATLWRDGQLVDLGTLNGTRSEATAINNRGQIVGAWSTDDGVSHGFLWEHGQMRDLGLPAFYVPVDINDRGVVLVATLLQPQGGVLWRDGVLAEIEASGVRQLNNRGEVIGVRELAPGGSVQQQAFLWRGGSATVLPTLPGVTRTWAYAINDRGDIVGNTIDDQVVPYDLHVVMWRGGRLIDLTRTGVPGDVSVIGVSNNGVLAGNRLDPEDSSRLLAVVYM
jgi:probable HAF family extracellular repeat protein